MKIKRSDIKDRVFEKYGDLGYGDLFIPARLGLESPIWMKGAVRDTNMTNGDTSPTEPDDEDVYVVEAQLVVESLI